MNPGEVTASEGKSHAAQRTTVAAKKSFVVYTIVEVDERAVWRRVGHAFMNRDGSFNLYLDALPVNGRLHMRELESQGQHQSLNSER